ncbi:MAG TPA: TonB-dependent receptor [Gemmatimonadales bacterium]|nr:TonB-dependent receptor [Gemmatimonadales bacterium]
MLAAFAAALALTPRQTAAQQPTAADTAARDTLARDTTVQQLKTLEVTVTRTAEPLSRVPAAVSVLDRAEIRRAQPTLGLDEALNDLPGVYVANRYNFSLDQRLSIRGFGSRANFGTRGVKILLDGVPQTLPDGQSQLTNVEFGLIDRVEVLRGSASSLYGNASGGVISLQTETADPGPFSQYVRAEGGAFGLFKWQTRTHGRLGAASGVLSLSRATLDGFRQQSAADLRLLNAGIDYALSGNDLLTLRFNAADDPQAQNPGALTPAEYAANPDSASAGNIRRGADKDVSQEQLAFGYKHVGNEGDEYGVTIFGVLRDLNNPLATPPPQGPGPTIGTYVRIGRAVGGVRATGTRRIGQGTLAPQLTAGVDFQYLRDNRSNFRSVSGAPTDSVLVDQREQVDEVGPFVQANWTPTPRVRVSGGARYDRVHFAVDDRHLTDGRDDSGDRTLDAWDGNGGVSYFVSDAVIPYVNVASSFETPTTTELANRPDGSGGFNDALGPQRAWTYEVGARGRIGTRVEYSVAAFLGRVSDAIVQFEEVGGRAFFRNAGKTHNDGVELGLSVTPIRGLRVFGSYTFADYIFADYKVQNGASVDTLDGHRLPGVPEHFARLGLRADLPRGFAVDVDHTLSSSLFADDDNTFEVAGWGAGVTNLRVSWRGETGRTRVTPFIGINNLFDKRYIASVTINGFDRLANAPRVIEPAPGISLYAGGEIGFRAGQ